MAIVGESVDDLAVVKAATEGSLKLTQGKVTELTPYPLPESLVMQYLKREDFKSANQFAGLTVDGLKTCVQRNKIDAIVLQLCLLKAKEDKREAMKLAFECSPQFGNKTSYGTGVAPPSRGLLIQHMQVWAKDLGFKTIFEAESKIMAAPE
jgi:hypothetical protein